MKKNILFLLLVLTGLAVSQTAVQDLTELTAPADGDIIYIEDVSDTTEDATGTGKYITRANLFGEINELGMDEIAAETLIATGVFTASTSYMRVGAESGTSDSVSTITWSGATDGQILMLSVTSGDTITFTNDTAGAANLDLGSNVVLDSSNERLILQFDGTNWVQLANSANIESVEKTVSETFTILEPDAVQGVSDDIVLKKFVAEDYPNGVTINAIHIDASAAYTSETFLFEHWDDASGTTQATVESITCTGISTEDDGALTDATIPADYFLVVNLDDTPEDVAYVAITIQYTVD